jgi:hypothetical protein
MHDFERLVLDFHAEEDAPDVWLMAVRHVEELAN